MRRFIVTALMVGVLVPAAQSSTQQATLRQIPIADDGPIGAVSPDGRFAAFRKPIAGRPRLGDLVLRDLTKGTVRTLVTHAENGYLIGTNTVSWSTDSRRLAFAWCQPQDQVAKTQASCEVRTISSEGGTPATLVPRLRGQVEVFSWSPDNSGILGSVRQGQSFRVALISTVDGSLRDLPFSDLDGDADLDFGSQPFSPDGRFIAYTRWPFTDKPYDAYLPRGVFVLSLSDGEDRPLIDSPASETFVAWSPDGGVLYTTDQSGTNDLLHARIVDGRAVGIPAVVRREIGAISGHALTRSGQLIYETEYQEHTDLEIATLDRARGSASAQSRLLSLPGRRIAKPVWIEDGKYLLFRTAPAKPTPMFMTDGYDAMAIHNPEDGSTREITIQHPCRDSWHSYTVASGAGPGAALIAIDGSAASCRGIYTVDLTNGKAQALIEGPNYLTEAQYLPGGKELLYVRSYFALTVRTLGSGTDRVVIDTRKLSDELESGSFHSVSLSHSGNKVAAMIRTRDKRDHLVEVSLLDGQVRRIPGVTLGESPFGAAIAWDADDQHLLYVDNGRPGTSGSVLRVLAGGGTPRSLGLTSVPDNQIAGLTVHPSGRLIAIQRDKTSNPKLFVLENFLKRPSGGSRRPN